MENDDKSLLKKIATDVSGMYGIIILLFIQGCFTCNEVSQLKTAIKAITP